MELLEGLTPATTTTAAEWWTGARNPRGGPFPVPRQFEAVARVHHRLRDGRSWAETLPAALAAGAGDPPPMDAVSPHVEQSGALDPVTVDHLVPLLQTATSTPDRCHFGLWAGWGGLTVGSSFALPGATDLPGRRRPNAAHPSSDGGLSRRTVATFNRDLQRTRQRRSASTHPRHPPGRTPRTAAKAYLLRAAHLEFPRGAGDIWYPDTSERRPCCDALRKPTRMFPDGLRKHCMTYRHIAALTDVDEKDIKTAVRLARRLHHESSARTVVAVMMDIATVRPGTTIEDAHQWPDTGYVPPVTPCTDEILLAAAERH